MPQLIEHIDAIARKKQRGVLFVRFSESMDHGDEIDNPSSHWNWESSAIRQTVIEWLDKERISWCCCGDAADTHSTGCYAGQIYIDVLFAETDSIYQRVLGYLENPDGSPRLPGVLLFVLQLQIAMKNAHHDEPGFWERWAENL